MAWDAGATARRSGTASVRQREGPQRHACSACSGGMLLGLAQLRDGQNEGNQVRDESGSRQRDLTATIAYQRHHSRGPTAVAKRDHPRGRSWLALRWRDHLRWEGSCDGQGSACPLHRRAEDGVWCAHAQLRHGVGANGEGDTHEAAIADLREALTGLIVEFGTPDELTLTLDVASCRRSLAAWRAVVRVLEIAGLKVVRSTGSRPRGVALKVLAPRATRPMPGRPPQG